MGIWKNVTDTFSEERRHYSNTYLEICEVYDEAVEVSVFSAVNNPYEIYVSYGIMYGIIYCSQEEAYEKFEEIKSVLENDYEENKEPSNEFINAFIETYGGVCRMMYYLMYHHYLNCFSIALLPKHGY